MDQAGLAIELGKTASGALRSAGQATHPIWRSPAGAGLRECKVPIAATAPCDGKERSSAGAAIVLGSIVLTCPRGAIR